MKLNRILGFLVSFSLFYNSKQTKREVLKEFKEELRKEKAFQNDITIEFFNSLSTFDKAIIKSYSKFERKQDNSIYMSMITNYSPSGIKYRISSISERLLRLIITQEIEKKV